MKIKINKKTLQQNIEVSTNLKNKKDSSTNRTIWLHLQTNAIIIEEKKGRASVYKRYMDCEIEGDTTNLIGVDCFNFLSLLKQFNEGEITMIVNVESKEIELHQETIIFDITGKESLCGLHGMDDNCLDILMPMKVNEGDFE